MSTYYEGLKKYFKGQFKDAANTLYQAGCSYVYTGDIEKAKEAFYYAGKALYDYQKIKEREKGSIDYRELVPALLYFKISEAKKDLFELLEKIRGMEKYHKSIDFRNMALLLLIRSLENYNVNETLSEIDHLIDLWMENSIKEHQRMIGAYILLQIARNILLKKREVVKALWLRYESDIQKLYPKFFEPLRLMIHGFLESREW